MLLTGAKCQEITNLESSADRVSSIMNAREISPFVMMVLLLSEFLQFNNITIAISQP
jgi:hypothetical protein